MILSMTGYGAAQTSANDLHITVTLKSLNSKFLETKFVLPQHYQQQELWIKNLLATEVQRGKLSLTLSIERLSSGGSGIPFDSEKLATYHAELQRLADKLNPGERIAVTSLLTLPGVMADSLREVDEEEWELARQTIEKAVQAFKESRRTEGRALQADFEHRAKLLADYLNQVEPYEPGRVENIKQRLLAALAELKDSVTVNDERLQQELIFYLEKYDITEEKTRIRTHLKYFNDTLHDKEAQGRKLLFIAQELWREINTLGNKANEVNIQKIVVQMKDELEKIKEQVMNIL